MLIQDMQLGRLVPTQGPLSQEDASWTEWGLQESLVSFNVSNEYMCP